MLVEWEMAMRLLLSCILGGCVGYEREAHQKSAGLRTHVLVSIGSCLIMILSIKIYTAVQGFTNADPARLAAQVVSGIGFLGAGSIIKEGPTVKGLTTAASLWVVSGIGLAVGAGYYMGALMTTALVFLTLTILSRMENKDYQQMAMLTVTTIDKPGKIGEIGSILGQYNINIRDIKIDGHEGILMITFMLYISQGIKTNEVTLELMNIEGISCVKME